ncbi:DNA polymerase beta domain-containing protein [Gloeomargarita lithophora Alchichica-D10]|uniref:DNA polymerase beta domain-containing protein n=1 Tax=Gloeomargarita lithophora Alchichica-D10 TaxID=1188229 RepID=A0A1J0ACW2_9CYAN|nr:nucleotidyltransferase domain-containing protein [Gloeomargarita lithophora]APB33752.1 DNA polymerase beta domain-containing protein [Gloeomargarita lithophora Alchichica-D10]
MRPEWQMYISNHQKREQLRQLQLEKRQEKGWVIAQKCAKILQEKYGATKVVLFGSMLTKIHEQSDIDLAVWGLADRFYFPAYAELLDISNFSIDLVPVQNAYPHLLKAIDQGHPL